MGRYDKKYEEQYARLSLLDINPNWKSLQCTDKPDLQSESAQIGIEVTSAVPTRIREIDEYGKKYLGQIVSKDVINSFKGEFFLYEGTKKVLAFSATRGLTTPNSEKGIIDSIKKKTEKINEYKRFSKNGLYVFTYEFFDKNCIEKMGSVLREANNGTFDFIFLNCINYIFYLSLNAECKVESFFVSEDKLKEYKQLAQELRNKKAY